MIATKIAASEASLAKSLTDLPYIECALLATLFYVVPKSGVIWSASLKRLVKLAKQIIRVNSTICFSS